MSRATQRHTPPSGCPAPSSIAHPLAQPGGGSVTPQPRRARPPRDSAPGRGPTLPAPPPHVLAIGATRLPAQLRALGVAVRQVPSLLDGYAEAVHRLDRAAPPRATLLLVDLQAVEPDFPELAAPQLVAGLAHGLHAGTLHPAWLIGLSERPDPDLDAEAYLAGCHLVLHLPLRATLRARLAALAALPAGLPPSDRATLAYQRAAWRVLQVVQAAQIPVWTAEDARVLLAALTAYPLTRAAGTRPAQADVRRVLRALGGPRAARRQLQAIQGTWQARLPLHAEILRLFLSGWRRADIVHSFVDRQLYEDSRIYACITELPQRVAEALRLAQARAEEEDT